MKVGVYDNHRRCRDHRIRTVLTMLTDIDEGQAGG
jgi:hypothetical protein